MNICVNMSFFYLLSQFTTGACTIKLLRQIIISRPCATRVVAPWIKTRIIFFFQKTDREDRTDQQDKLNHISSRCLCFIKTLFPLSLLNGLAHQKNEIILCQ